MPAIITDEYQSLVLRTATAIWGKAAMDPRECALRLLEEAIELVQACALDYDDLVRVGLHVFSRPVGEVDKEIGGTILTLAALAEVHSVDMTTRAVAELSRLLGGDPTAMRARHMAKPKSIRGEYDVEIS